MLRKLELFRIFTCYFFLHTLDLVGPKSQQLIYLANILYKKLAHDNYLIIDTLFPPFFNNAWQNELRKWRMKSNTRQFLFVQYNVALRIGRMLLSFNSLDLANDIAFFILKNTTNVLGYRSLKLRSVCKFLKRVS